MIKSTKAKEAALGGMLFALAVVLSIAEAFLTPALGLPPGVKPGLANIVVMYALFFLGSRQALSLVVLKALFGLLTRGVSAGALSLAGGLLSLLVMVLLMQIPRGQVSYYMLSVFGAVSHNMGQLLLAALWMKVPYTFAYAPVLLVSGIAMGSLTAVSLKLLLPALERTGFRTGDICKPGKK